VNEVIRALAAAVLAGFGVGTLVYALGSAVVDQLYPDLQTQLDHVIKSREKARKSNR